MVDYSVIKAVKKHKESAFKTMYESSIPYVFTIVRRYISNSSDHADVIQEIFARVFLGIQSFDPSKGEFKYWIRRIAINQCMQYFRKAKSQPYTITLEPIHDENLSVVQQWDKWTAKEIEDYLHFMPEGYKRIFMLIEIDGYSHKEVAELLDITSETSRSQLSRAKKWLSKKNSKHRLKIVADGL